MLVNPHEQPICLPRLLIGASTREVPRGSHVGLNATGCHGRWIKNNDAGRMKGNKVDSATVCFRASNSTTN